MSGRVLDANVNRAAEGLRVLEEAARLLLGDAALSLRAKELRHRLRAALPTALLAGRNLAGDVGAGLRVDDEMRRRGLGEVLRANGARVQEALRAAEEFAKVVDMPALAVVCMSLRHASYDLERDLLARMPAARLAQERLYALVDAGLCAQAGVDPVVVAGAVARGGAGLVQLRAKACGQRAYRDLAERVQEVVARAGALFVVNDHVAVAAVLAADALHLGQDDLTLADARRVLGPLCAIGLSCHDPAQAQAALEAGADYLGLGPMFATATKAQEASAGPELLDALRGRLDRPSFAIGGLDLARLRTLRPRLLHGVAVAGALCLAPDPERAAAAWREVLDNG